MKEIAEKLKSMEVSISEKKGPFDLFALFLREDAPDRWDLVVAANWIEKNKQEALKFISREVSATLTPNELIKLSRITIIDESNPALEALTKSMGVEHGLAEIRDDNYFGLQIKHGYLITSKRREHKVLNSES